FNENANVTDKTYDAFNVQIKRLDTTDKNSREMIYNFVLAFLNFINNPEIKIIEVNYSDKKNEKRIK
ncbi:unnamed protein product, partial [marine sediment metagenome]